MVKTAGIIGLTFASAAFAGYGKVPLAILPITTIGGLSALFYTRKRQKEMRQDLTEIMSLVPQQASGIVQHELSDFEKILNTGNLNFGTHDLDPRKHLSKYGASLFVGFLVPGLMPQQYLMMLTGDEVARLRIADQKAIDVISQNKPAP